MAMKRCPDCGEKYSDSYKYCPFCEEEEILREGKGRGGRRARQSRSFSLLTPVLVVLILLMAGLLIFLHPGRPGGSQGTCYAPARRGDAGAAQRAGRPQFGYPGSRPDGSGHL